MNRRVEPAAESTSKGSNDDGASPILRWFIFVALVAPLVWLTMASTSRRSTSGSYGIGNVTGNVFVSVV
ncbi:hypothetical protein HN51_041035 [Arachis hypogaea]